MTRTTLRRLSGLVLALAAVTVAVAALAACGTSHSSDASAVTSFTADPAVSTDITQLENKLLASWKTYFSPAHPVRSSETAIEHVFPHGDTAATASFAVQQLSTSMIGSKPAAVTARHAWAQKVVTKALGPAGTATASPAVPASPGSTLPGTASPVATFSPRPSTSTTGAGA